MWIIFWQICLYFNVDGKIRGNEEEILWITKSKFLRTSKFGLFWNADEEEWYFSVVDIVSILTDNDYQTARNYWKVLRKRLSNEGSELVTNCNRLKMEAFDGKMRETDCLDSKGVLWLVQSIPSPKAEPFKIWLAKVGSERLDEIADPEKAILRGATYYRAKGYTEGWINQRLQTIEMRKKTYGRMERPGN